MVSAWRHGRSTNGATAFVNVAQMEMRIILCHLFRNFRFELAPPTSTADPSSFVGVNRATLGPRDTGVSPSKPAVLGLYLTATPRALLTPTAGTGTGCC